MSWVPFAAAAQSIASTTSMIARRARLGIGGDGEIAAGPYAPRRNPLWKRVLINAGITLSMVGILAALVGITWGLFELGRYLGGGVGLAIGAVLALVMWVTIIATALGLDEF